MEETGAEPSGNGDPCEDSRLPNTPCSLARRDVAEGTEANHTGVWGLVTTSGTQDHPVPLSPGTSSTKQRLRQGNGRRCMVAPFFNNQHRTLQATQSAAAWRIKVARRKITIDDPMIHLPISLKCAWHDLSVIVPRLATVPKGVDPLLSNWS